MNLSWFVVLMVALVVFVVSEDYYKLLGLERGASDKEIRKAFRRLALKYHPDKNKDPDAQAHFIKIAEAYEVLSNRDKRAHFDTSEPDPSSSSDHHYHDFNHQEFNYQEFYQNFDDAFRMHNQRHNREHFRAHFKAHKSNFPDGYFDNLFDDFEEDDEDFFMKEFGGDWSSSQDSEFSSESDSSDISRSENLQGGGGCTTTTFKRGNTVSKQTVCTKVN